MTGERLNKDVVRMKIHVNSKKSIEIRSVAILIFTITFSKYLIDKGNHIWVALSYTNLKRNTYVFINC